MRVDFPSPDSPIEFLLISQRREEEREGGERGGRTDYHSGKVKSWTVAQLLGPPIAQ